MGGLPRLSAIEAEILDLLKSGEKYGLEMVRLSPLLKRGTIYVTLERMAAKGYVTSRAVEDSADGLPRRSYSITALGRKVMMLRDAATGYIAMGAPA